MSKRFTTKFKSFTTKNNTYSCNHLANGNIDVRVYTLDAEHLCNYLIRIENNKLINYSTKTHFNVFVPVGFHNEVINDIGEYYKVEYRHFLKKAGENE